MTAPSPRPVNQAIPQRRPLMVYTLIVLNAAAYVATVVQAGSFAHNADSPLFDAWSLVPQDFTLSEWWRLGTNGFMHFGLMHLALNMISLWLVGKEFELVLGRGRFLVVYLLSVLGGSVGVLLFSQPNVQAAGASGAVFGLMGGFAYLAYKMGFSPAPALVMIAVNLAYSVAMPNISLAAHVGGLITGTVLTALMISLMRLSNRRTRREDRHPDPID